MKTLQALTYVATGVSVLLGTLEFDLYIKRFFPDPPYDLHDLQIQLQWPEAWTFTGYEIANEGTDWFSRLTASKVSVNAARQVVYTTMWEAAAELVPAGRQVIEVRTARHHGRHARLR